MAGIVELDGKPHGFGDVITTSDQTWEREADYCLIKNLWVCVLNYKLTDGYNREKVIETLINAKLPRLDHGN